MLEKEEDVKDEEDCWFDDMVVGSILFRVVKIWIVEEQRGKEREDVKWHEWFEYLLKV